MGSVWKGVAGGFSAVVAAVVLSSCASSPSATETTTTTRPPASTRSSTTSTTETTTSPTETTEPTATTATTTSTTTTATTATTATCRFPALRVADVGQGGAAGTQEVTFSLTNSSTTPCRTYGYPGMLLVTTSGTALPTTVDRGGSLTFEDVAPTTVTLGPEKTAYFNVGYTDVPVGTTSCSTTRSAEVTPPTDTAYATVDVHLGIDACDDGTLHVSAVFSSTDSTATQTTAPS